MKVVLYHGGCTDGFAAAYAAFKKLGDYEVSYVPMYYGTSRKSTINQIPLGVEELIVLDVSFTSELFNMLVVREPKKITWSDHHTSSLEELGHTGNNASDTFEYEGISVSLQFNVNHSGCILAWRHFNGDCTPPSFFWDIDDQDRFVNERPNARAFKFGLGHSKPWSFEQWSAMQKNYSKVVNLGLQAISFHDPMVARLAHQRVEVTLKDSEGRVHKGFAANCPNQMFTDVGHKLAVASGTFGLVWNMNNQGLIVAQLRGVDVLNCGSIARHYGGGGHTNAAGFEMNLPNFLVLLGQA